MKNILQKCCNIAKLLYLCKVNKNKNKMKTQEMNFTGITIKYENGHKAGVYSKCTKTGIKYYRWSSRRFFPISKTEIELRKVIN